MLGQGAQQGRCSHRGIAKDVSGSGGGSGGQWRIVAVGSRRNWIDDAGALASGALHKSLGFGDCLDDLFENNKNRLIYVPNAISSRLLTFWLS